MDIDADQRTLAGFGLAVVVSLAVGFLAGGVLNSPTGAFVGEAVSDEEIESTVNQIIDQQMQQQEQQLAMAAQQSEELSEDDLSMNTEIVSIEQSQFGSLIAVTVSNTGEVPSRTNPEETETVDEEQVFYISEDGRYLFQEPMDLEAVPEEPAGPEQAPQPEEP